MTLYPQNGGCAKPRYYTENFLQGTLILIAIKSKRGKVKIMKKELHPEYVQANVKCVCGNEFVAGSTATAINVEVCSKCHPFYTGSQKLLLEAGGRVEKFKKKYSR